VEVTFLKRYPAAKPTVLWVDDDRFDLAEFARPFYASGYNILTATHIGEALETLDKQGRAIDLVILDVRIPAEGYFSQETTRGGFQTGISLACEIKRKYPGIPIMGFSVHTEAEVVDWFRANCQGYLKKMGATPDQLFAHADAIVRKTRGPARKPKMFIVHGHDEISKLELKNYVQNTLGLGEPVILHGQPDRGRTIIEKLEEETADVDIVFVLLTPDDIVADSFWPDEKKRRARQNVIFELGYFYGMMKRRHGKIILCYKGPIELPSDMAGLIYLDISNGTEVIGEKLRRELHEWLIDSKKG
jgi:predicted nucleotide-binding protein